jgi:hypothetical protein
MPVIPTWKRPDRPSFPAVLLGTVYVAVPKPDEDGYTLRRYVPGDEHDTDLSVEQVGR